MKILVAAKQDGYSVRRRGKYDVTSDGVVTEVEEMTIHQRKAKRDFDEKIRSGVEFLTNNPDAYLVDCKNGDSSVIRISRA